MIEVKPIARCEILEGFGHPYFCCMFGIEKRSYHCPMWKEIYDEVGNIGYLARSDEKIVGQLISIPKIYARKIGLATSSLNTELKRTLVINCLYVLREFGGRGIAGEMIGKLIEFGLANNYVAIEAFVHPGTPAEAGMSTCFAPFKKFGFQIDPRIQIDKSNVMKICHKKLA